jgi:DNA-binding response OmpR family regulator
MKKAYQIAIVEDDLDDQYLMKSATANLDYDIEFEMFTSGKDFVSEVNERLNSGGDVPDIIFLDLNLPDWDGKKTLKRLRAIQAMLATPIIIYTTSRSEKDMDDVYELGATSYIVKAMSFEKIERNMKLICDYWLDLVGVQGRTR